MDISGILSYFSSHQKNVFTVFCISLPLVFSILYLYVPAFEEMPFYVQVIFSFTASILISYCSYVLLCVTSTLGRVIVKLDILVLVSPILISSFYLLRDPKLYSLGYEYALLVFLRCSLVVFVPIALFGFITFVAKKYDKKHKGSGVDNCGDI